jgi:hypothetical protein
LLKQPDKQKPTMLNPEFRQETSLGTELAHGGSGRGGSRRRGSSIGVGRIVLPPLPPAPPSGGGAPPPNGEPIIHFWYITNNVPYAPFVEYGTSRMAPRYMLTLAFQEVSASFDSIVAPYHDPGYEES